MKRNDHQPEKALNLAIKGRNKPINLHNVAKSMWATTTCGFGFFFLNKSLEEEPLKLNCCFRQWCFSNFVSTWRYPSCASIKKPLFPPQCWGTCMEVRPLRLKQSQTLSPQHQCCCCVWIEANPCSRFEHLVERLKSQKWRLLELWIPCLWLWVEMITQYTWY